MKKKVSVFLPEITKKRDETRVLAVMKYDACRPKETHPNTFSSSIVSHTLYTCSCNDAELFAIKINTLIIIRLSSPCTFMVFFFCFVRFKHFITTVAVSFRFISNEHATIESKSLFPLFIYFFLIKYLLFASFIKTRRIQPDEIKIIVRKLKIPISTVLDII